MRRSKILTPNSRCLFDPANSSHRTISTNDVMDRVSTIRPVFLRRRRRGAVLRALPPAPFGAASAQLPSLRSVQPVRHGLIIIEDDYDHEYRFDGRPILPLATRADAELPVIYVGSLSKLLAPAVRVGYVAARSDILARMADRREAIDRQGDLPLEQALAALIEDGTLRRHARKARRIYQVRRDYLAKQLIDRLGEDVTFDVPPGGLAIWLKLRPGLSAETWAANTHRAGLVVTPGLRFALDASRAPEAFRIGYASLDERELTRVVETLARTRPRLR